MEKKILAKRMRIMMMVFFGLAVGLLLLLLEKSWEVAFLGGWDVATILFLLSMIRDFTGHTAEQTESIAKSEDIDGWALDALVLVAATASLVAVAVLLGEAGEGHQLMRVSFGLVSIVLGWATVHMLYMVRYAVTYYQGKQAIEFNDKEQPQFSDFAYVAFTIGMTYQVSDTNFQSSKMRKVALGHALVSFVFGTVIIATTINLVAGLIG